MTNAEIGALFDKLEQAAERGDNFAVTLLYSRLRQYLTFDETVAEYIESKLNKEKNNG